MGYEAEPTLKDQESKARTMLGSFKLDEVGPGKKS